MPRPEPTAVPSPEPDAASPDTALDTVAAIATAPGGGVGIVRLSGPDALAIGRAGFRPLTKAPIPRRLHHGWWHGPDGEPLDEGLYVEMPGPRSFTGEDVVELHLHGGALTLTRALEACVARGARPAGPGEFSRRAFLAGRLELTQAEAVADLVAAQTDRALSAARRHLRGDLHRRALELRDEIVAVRAQLEVALDFVEEDVPVVSPAALADEADTVAEALDGLAATFERGRRLREGARVVLVGAPNAGKSSLFNRLVGAERAIVTPHPGTTRDTVEATVDLRGIPATLVDTAGLRETDDEVERAGIARTRDAAETADLVLHVRNPLEETSADAPGTDAGLRVATRADVAGSRARVAGGEHHVSAETGHGVEGLVDAMAEALGVSAHDPGELIVTRARHHAALTEAAGSVRRGATLLRNDAPWELAAVDLREACGALEELVGVVTDEDVLDVLFSRFCIGK